MNQEEHTRNGDGEYERQSKEMRLRQKLARRQARARRAGRAAGDVTGGSAGYVGGAVSGAVIGVPVGTIAGGVSGAVAGASVGGAGVVPGLFVGAVKGAGTGALQGAQIGGRTGLTVGRFTGRQLGAIAGHATGEAASVPTRVRLAHLKAQQHRAQHGLAQKQPDLTQKVFKILSKRLIWWLLLPSLPFLFFVGSLLLTVIVFLIFIEPVRRSCMSFDVARFLLYLGPLPGALRYTVCRMFGF